MIDIKFHKSINQLKDKWKKLEVGVSPFQTFEMNQMVWRNRLFYYLREKKTFIYAEVIEDGNTRLIAPLCRNIIGGGYSSLSSINGLRNYDFVYAHEGDISSIDYYVESLIDALDEAVDFDCVCEESPIIRYASKSKRLKNIQNIEQGAISFGDSYDAYISGLSKNAKQNIRTAYNRMNTDNRTYSFEVFTGTAMPKSVIKEMTAVYCKRRDEKYNNSSMLHSLYLRFIDWQTRYYNKGHLNFVAVLRIDNQIASFMSGFINLNKAFVSIPRLAIDSDYGRYSPGILLLNEAAKYFENKKEYNWLDLYGINATYKLQMNAKLYYKYKIEIGEKA